MVRSAPGRAFARRERVSNHVATASCEEKSNALDVHGRPQGVVSGHLDEVRFAEVVAATGASVHQGALDYEQCAHVWGNDDWLQVIADWFLANGVPPAEAVWFGAMVSVSSTMVVLKLMAASGARGEPRLIVR